MPRKKLLLRDFAPELEPQYHPANAVRFHEVAAHAGKFGWRCPEGHTWAETAATRRSLPAWKNGDPLACRVCTGEIVTHRCGHQKRSRNNSQPVDGPCSTCVWEGRGTMDALVEDPEGVDELADEYEATIRPVGDGPATLVAIASSRRRYALRGAAARALGGGDPAGIEDELAAAASITTASVLPAPDLCASSTVIPLYGLHNTAAWGPGLAHYQGLSGPPPPAWPELRQVVSDYLCRIPAEHRSTAVITNALWQLTRALSGPERANWWRMHRELIVPVAADGERWGRVDAVITPPASDGFRHPDVVIEIDQTNKARSVTKLAFARDAGAHVLWIRWGRSAAVAPDWLPVVDLTSE